MFKNLEAQVQLKLKLLNITHFFVIKRIIVTLELPTNYGCRLCSCLET